MSNAHAPTMGSRLRAAKRLTLTPATHAPAKVESGHARRMFALQSAPRLAIPTLPPSMERLSTSK